MNHIILSNSNTIINCSKEVLVDSCVFLATIMPDQAYSQNAVNFFKNSAQQNVNLYYNQSVLTEVSHKMKIMNLKQTASNAGIDITNEEFSEKYGYKKLVKQMSQINPNLPRISIEKANEQTDLILSTAEFLPESAGFDYPSIYYYFTENHGDVLEPSDVSLLITGYSYGINSFATFDFGFSAVDGINIVAMPTRDYREYKNSANSLLKPVDFNVMKNIFESKNKK